MPEAKVDLEAVKGQVEGNNNEEKMEFDIPLTLN